MIPKPHIIATRTRQEWLDACYLLGVEPRLADFMYPRLEHLDFILFGDIKVYVLKYETIARRIGREQYHPFRDMIAERE